MTEYQTIVADPPFEVTGEWLAGFIDGEGSIGIANHGGSYVQPRFRINQREDDMDIVIAIYEFIGAGSLSIKKCSPTEKYYSANARDQIALILVGTDCLKLIHILDKYPLRSKKRYEYPVWRTAVIDYSQNQSHRWADPLIKQERDKRMLEYKQQLAAIRVEGLLER